jgi:hypothetical protein
MEKLIKLESHVVEYIRGLQTLDGEDLFAEYKNGGLKICWTLQRQV